MDHTEQQHAQKNEPSLQASDAFSTVAPAPVTDGEEMPAWLNSSTAAPTAAQRWGRRFAFLGIAVLTIGLAGGATLLGLELYDSHHSMEVVSASAKADIAAKAAPSTAAPAVAPAPVAAEAAPLLEKRNPNLPPLVMLPQDPNAVAKKDPPAAGTPPAAPSVPAAAATTAAAATPAVSPPAVAQVKAPPAPTVAAVPAVIAAPAPLVTNKLEKADVPAAPGKPAKSATPTAKPAVQPVRTLAGNAKVAAKPKLAAAVKKPTTVAKRPATALAARAQPRNRPIKGTMLQPPRDRGLDPAFQDPPRQAIDRRCRAGELARECEARIR